MTKLEFASQKTYNLTHMITFWVSYLHTWIRTATSRIQQLPGVKKYILDDKIVIPLPTNITFDINGCSEAIHDNFYKWPLYLDQNCCQKFIFDDKIGFPIPKNIKFDIHEHLLGKWPLYLDKDGCQQDPAAARCTEIYFRWQNWNFNPKKHIIWHTWSHFG